MFSSAIAWLVGASLLPVVNSRLIAEDQSACTGKERIRSNWGVILSPNFPRPYSANLSCTWLITSSPDTILSLTFSSFDVTSAGDCARKRCGCDYLLVKDRSSSQKTRYCNENKPPAVIHLSTNKVKLHFRSDATNEAAGFSVAYASRDIVAKEMTANEKALVARDFPGNATESNRNSTNRTAITRRGEKSRSNYSTTPVPSAVHHTTSAPSASKDLSGKKSDLKPTTSRTLPPAHASSDVTIPAAGNGSVVFFVEPAAREEYVDDIVVLGPSVPIVFIFIAGVIGIAWWNFMKDRKEYDRIDRYGRFWKYFRKSRSNSTPPETRGVQRSASFAKKKHRDDMKEVRKHNKYSNMMRDWKGQAAATNPNLTSPRLGRKNSFAGRLTAPRETPRPSRPVSHAGDMRHIDKPVQTGREAGSTSGLARNTTSATSVTPSGSRPPSVLLKEALSLLFNVDTSDVDKSESRPGSKRVSFTREPTNPASLPETDEELEDVPLLQQDGDQESQTLNVEPRPINIPSIVVEATPENAPSAEELDPPDPGVVEDDEVFPDLEDFLLNLDKDISLEDPAYSCAHHVRDILRQSYGASEDPDSLSWEDLTVPEEFVQMIRSPQHRKQFEDVEEVD